MKSSKSGQPRWYAICLWPVFEFFPADVSTVVAIQPGEEISRGRPQVDPEASGPVVNVRQFRQGQRPATVDIGVLERRSTLTDCQLSCEQAANKKRAGSQLCIHEYFSYQ